MSTRLTDKIVKGLPAPPAPKVGMVGKVKFEARIKELVANFPDLAALVEPLLIVRRTLREQFCVLHRRLLAIVRDDEVCRRLMTVPREHQGFQIGLARK